MPPQEVTFRVPHEGPLAEFTRRHPGVTLSVWCNWESEVVEAAGAGAVAAEELESLLREHSPWVEPHPLPDGTHLFLLKCVGLPHDDVYERIDEAHCLHVPPMRVEEGREVYSMVAFSEEKMRTLFTRLREGGRAIELASKRPLEVQPLLNSRAFGANALFHGLTERQMEALLLAYRHGHYREPRSLTAAAIAESVGLSRSTFEEHLRKAENRVIANLAPYLELYAKARRGPPDSGPAKRASPATVWARKE